MHGARDSILNTKSKPETKQKVLGLGDKVCMKLWVYSPVPAYTQHGGIHLSSQHSQVEAGTPEIQGNLQLT